LWKNKLKMEKTTQKRRKNVSADKNGRPFQAVAHFCATLPTGNNTTTGQIRRIFEVLEID